MAHPDFTVRFWGVRGSIACPGPDTVRYGGNTSCVEIRCDGRHMIFDGGTGLRLLGQEIARTHVPVDLDLFYSHTHFDHIEGLPFFAPCYNSQNHIRIWAGHLPSDQGIEMVLSNMMMAPLFPIPIRVFAAKLDFIDFSGGESLVPHPGIELRTAPLNHPNGATGYRVEFAGKTVAYITDTEHRPGRRDANVMKLIERADVMIYDSTYTDEEYPAHRHWGHSTWQEGVRLADAAGVGTLVIFHHDPAHDDAFMDAIAAEAAKARPGTIVAQEGLVLRP
ncbi:MAG: MBL fold metallo-hydrolase [Alphaproteobacteria bacterium]|nr:MBL fold metallo-hydrolase [Alphaproteobacteria bacterium]